MSSKTSQDFVVLSPNEVDFDRVKFKDAITQKFKTGTESTQSDSYYEQEDGTKAGIYLRLPAQITFGVGYKYEMTFKPEKGKLYPEEAKGLQINYPITSLNTIATPTKEEKECRDCLNKLWQLAVDQGAIESNKANPVIPSPSQASYIMAKQKNNFKDFIKYPFQAPKLSDKGPRPDSMYINLITYGKGLTLKNNTKFYDAEGNLLDFNELINIRGKIEPCIKFEGIYWGAHGKNPHGGSLRFRLVEANFYPINYSNIPQGRLLKSSNVSTVEVEQLPKSELEEDDSDPLQVMNKPPKKTPVVTKPKIVKKPQIQLKKAPPKPAPKKAPVPAPEPDEEMDEVEPEME